MNTNIKLNYSGLLLTKTDETPKETIVLIKATKDFLVN